MQQRYNEQLSLISAIDHWIVIIKASQIEICLINIVKQGKHCTYNEIHKAVQAAV